MKWESIESIAKQVVSGKTTAEANVKRSLKRAKETADYGSLISLLEEPAVKRAKRIDKLVAEKKHVGRLAGVPFIAKDNFLVFGAKTTAASNILKTFEAPYQATAIERLEAEGAICIGKANLDAFAHGSSTENSDMMITKNPHNKEKVPGGSSGGSAASVVLGIAPFALGTDTGGSIRLPASFCGAVGFKPSYGLVSRYGVIAMASSTDCIGPITNSVEDAALVVDIISGRDVYDSTTIARQDHYVPLKADLKGKKVGIVKEYFGEGIDEEVRKSIDSSLQAMKDAGAIITEVSIPSLPLALGVYYIICPAEVSSNLSRYDGQRFGHFSSAAQNLEESYAKARAEGFGAEAKRRIMIGTYVLSSGYYDAYYKKAALVRTKIINEFQEAFMQVDFLVGPTSPITAFKIGENVSDPLKMYLIDIMTVAANLVGVPAISIPSKPASTMPIGLQIIGQFKRDLELLEFSLGVQETIR